MALQKNNHFPSVGIWHGGSREIYTYLASFSSSQLYANSSRWSNTTRGQGQGVPIIQSMKVNLLKFEAVWRRAKSRSGGAHHPIWLPLVTPCHITFLHYTCNPDIFFLICVSVSLTVNSRVFCLVHQYVPEIKSKPMYIKHWISICWIKLARFLHKKEITLKTVIIYDETLCGLWEWYRISRYT